LPAFIGAGVPGSGITGAPAVGPEVSGVLGGADMVDEGADLDPHAARNRVAAISFLVTIRSE
jgi:hypothetical protein